MKRRIFTAAVMGAAMSAALGLGLGPIAAPALAQDDSAEDGGGDAETDTLLAYLGLTASAGKTTFGDGAGSTEAFILATLLMRKPADAILGELEKGKTYLVVTDKTKVDLSPRSRVIDRVNTLREKTVEFLTLPEMQLCRWSKPELEATLDQNGFRDAALENRFNPAKGASTFEDITPESTEKTAKFKFAFSDFLGLMRSDTEIKNAPISVESDILVSALLARHKKVQDDSNPPKPIAFKIWSEIAKPATAPQFTIRLNNIVFALTASEKACATGETANAKKLASKVKALKDAAGLFTAPGKDNGPSLLEMAERIAGVYDGIADEQSLRILRLAVNKSGGTVINNNSIWTSIGVPGVTVRSGLVVSYRVIDPQTGGIDDIGIRACAFPKKRLASVAALQGFKLKDRGKCIDPLGDDPFGQGTNCAKPRAHPAPCEAPGSGAD